MINNHGVRFPLQSKVSKRRSRNTCMRRYGVEFPLQSEEVKKKSQNTCIERYGVTNAFQCESVKKKSRDTCIEKYGVDSWAKTYDGRRSSRLTAIKFTESQRLNGEPLMPRVGDLERPFLDGLQKYTNYKILRQDPRFRYVIGRFPDGHIPELKLCILFDEYKHFTDKECSILNEDSIHETENYHELPHHTLFRVSQKDWEENPDQIITKFKQLTKEEYVR